MEGYDLVSDSYSMEILILLVVERIWGRISTFLQERHDKIDKQKEDARMDKIAENLSEIRGKQEGFQHMINKLK